LVAATKYDKLTRSQRAPALATLRKGFGIKEHELVGVSSVTGEGLDALWAIIAPHVEAGRR
jgi:GTP-binding protein EngB required for normal cell division